MATRWARQLLTLGTSKQARNYLGLPSLITQEFLAVQLFTDSSGTITFNSDTGSVFGILQAAGGGGGGNGATAGQGGGGHGGAGETRLFALPVTPLTKTYTYTLGAIGTGGTAGNNAGTDAADSTFVEAGVALITAKGGTKGGGSAGNAAGTMGTTPTGSGGIALLPTSAPQYTFATGGPRGASTIFGWHNLNIDGIITVIVAGTGAYNGLTADGYGAGGMGSFKQAGTTSAAGGNGAPAFLALLECR